MCCNFLPFTTCIQIYYNCISNSMQMSLELGISTAFVFLYQRIGTKVSMSLHIFTRCLVILPKLLMLVQFCIECLVINLELLGTYGDDWLLSSVLLGYIWSAKRNMILIEITSWNLSEIRRGTMTEIFDRKYHKKLIRQEEKKWEVGKSPKLWL